MMNRLASDLMAARGIDRRAFLKQASLTFLALAPVAAGLDWAEAAEPSFVVAETAFGKIRGMENQGIRIFKGVPYGGTTTGQNRFMPPTNPGAWTGTRDTLQYGPTTPQRNPDAVVPPAEYLAVSRIPQ